MTVAGVELDSHQGRRRHLHRRQPDRGPERAGHQWRRPRDGRGAGTGQLTRPGGGRWRAVRTPSVERPLIVAALPGAGGRVSGEQRPTSGSGAFAGNTPWWRPSSVALVVLAHRTTPRCGRGPMPPDPPTTSSQIVVDRPADAHAARRRSSEATAFLRLVVDRGTAVEVYGYRGEPYIQLPRRRHGAGEPGVGQLLREPVQARQRRCRADFVDDALPEWHTVATDGDYAWHDHRTHWMIDTRSTRQATRRRGAAPVAAMLRSTAWPVAIVGRVGLDAALRRRCRSGWAAPSARPAGRRHRRSGSRPLAEPLRRVRRSAARLAVLATRGRRVAVPGTFPAGDRAAAEWFACSPAVAALAAARRASRRICGARAARSLDHALLLLAGVNLVRVGMDAPRRVQQSHPRDTNAPGWLDRFASGRCAWIAGCSRPDSVCTHCCERSVAAERSPGYFASDLMKSTTACTSASSSEFGGITP